MQPKIEGSALPTREIWGEAFEQGAGGRFGGIYPLIRDNTG
jgi:hypothetical protein